eukprot:7452983-Heterocapsa_arctica.AAC.1
MQRRLLLEVVVGQRAAIYKLLACEAAGLTCERLHEDLHAAAQAQPQMQRRLLLEVVVGQRAAIPNVLAGEDRARLVLPAS